MNESQIAAYEAFANHERFSRSLKKSFRFHMAQAAGKNDAHRSALSSVVLEFILSIQDLNCSLTFEQRRQLVHDLLAPSSDTYSLQDLPNGSFVTPLAP